MTLTCRSDGTFDAAPPNCTTAYCDNPALNITNGQVEHLVENGTVAGKFLENDILRYECDPTYRLVGDEVISCGADGQWNGTTDAHCELSKSTCYIEIIWWPCGSFKEGSRTNNSS